jgi:hypothetical protein
VHETEEEAAQFREPMGRDPKAGMKKSDQLDKDGNLFSGLTPPTTRILKRKFEEAYKYGRPGLYKREEVSRVEAELADQSGVHEELVDFEDYMVDRDGKGIRVNADSDLVRKYPEIMMSGEHREEYLANGKLVRTQAQAKKEAKKAKKAITSASQSKKRPRSSAFGGAASDPEPEDAADEVDPWAELNNEVGVDDDDDDDEPEEDNGNAAAVSAQQQAAFARYASCRH